MAAPLAVVTGASRGIGRLVAIGLRERGCRVAALARSADELRTLAADHGCDAVPVDLADGPALKEAVQALLARHGPCGVLVNNAGYGLRGAVEEVDVAAFRRQLEVNVVAPVILSQLLLPGMRARRRGTIVHVGSVAGRVAVPLSGAYAATKFALRALADAQRVEVAPFGISVVWVEPGPVRTAFAEVAASASERVLADPSSPYRAAYARLAASLGALHDRAAWPADAVARRIVDAALAPEPPRVVPAYGGLLRMSTWLHAVWPGAFDRMVARRMGITELGPPG